MIHMAQCLCGPERHAIYGVMYDDSGGATPEEAKAALEIMIETWIEEGRMRRRCEICGKDVKQFWYEDGITKEQDWDKAQAEARLTEIRQALTREAVMAARKAGKN